MTNYNNCSGILTGTSVGKRPIGWPRSRWEGNIRMDLKEICQYEEFA